MRKRPIRVFEVAMKIFPTTEIKEPIPFVIMNFWLDFSWSALAVTEELQKF
jgi:hypothetical protein